MKTTLLFPALAFVTIATASAQPSTHSTDAPRSLVHAASDIRAVSPAASVTSSEAEHVVRFWREAGPALWFAKDDEFDGVFRAHFLAEYEAAARGDLDAWAQTASGALALMILLDQFPRNAFRGTPRMYATDSAARRHADAAIARGHDRAVPEQLQLFFYLPFAHSERLADQERSVQLCRRLGEMALTRAEHHRDIVRRFGRFPHRNPILGRSMTAEEQAYLDDGGFGG